MALFTFPYACRPARSYIAEYTSEEYKRGNIGLVGPLQQAECLNIQLNPLGAIPKDKPNKWKLNPPQKATA